MSKEIKINQMAVSANVGAISGAIQYIEEVALVPNDSNSTIIANLKGKETYAKSQQVIGNLKSAVRQEAVNIRSLGITFQEYDERISRKLEKL